MIVDGENIPSELLKELRQVYADLPIHIIERKEWSSISDNAFANSVYPVEFLIGNPEDGKRCIYKPEGDYSSKTGSEDLSFPKFLLKSSVLTECELCEIPIEAISLGGFYIDESVDVQNSLALQMQRRAKAFLRSNSDLLEGVAARFPSAEDAFLIVPNSNQLIFIY